VIAAIEGLPYAGKTTLIEHVRATSRSRWIHCLPEIVSSELREYEGAERRQATLSYYHFNDKLKSRACESLPNDALVLLDRYFPSTVVCDSVLNDSCEPAAIWQRVKAYEGIVLPDVVIYLDVSVDEVSVRARSDGGSRLLGPWRLDRLAQVNATFRSTLEAWCKLGLFQLAVVRSVEEVLALLDSSRTAPLRRLVFGLAPREP
jgi:thymidylate kinase